MRERGVRWMMRIKLMEEKKDGAQEAMKSRIRREKDNDGSG